MSQESAGKSAPDDGPGTPARSPDFFRRIVERLPVCMLVKDLDGTIIYANPAVAEAMQRDVEQIVGVSDFDLFSKELAEKYQADDRQVIASGEPLVIVEENRRGEEVVHFEVRKSPLRDADGKIIGVKALFWDVSKRRAAEQALEHEQFLLRTLMEHLPDSIYFKDADSRFMRVSRGLARKFGFDDPQDIVGKSDADIFSAEHAREAREDEQRIMRTGQPVIEQIEKETWESREDTWCSSTKLPLHGEDGQIVGTFGMTRDVTSLVKTEEALRRAKDLAEEASRAKSDFLANMSHEIRTPMNAIIGITELLLQDHPTAHQREYLSMLLASGESLLAIINDVLDFSKIEAGKFELLPAPCNLRNALGDTMKAMGVQAHEKGLELIAVFEPDVPSAVELDLGRLRQAVINLVGNAIKFTEHGEVVVIVGAEAMEGDGVCLSIEVRDTGVGIPLDKQERIFAEFEQADGSTTRNYGGTGLGLAISSRLAQLMGGEITVQSEPGVGSTFRLSVEATVVQWDDIDMQQTLHQLRALSVLIVDDNATNRRILCDVLQHWQMVALPANSGAEALALLNESYQRGEEVAMMITDINMPEMDGFELSAAVRADDRFAKLPIVALTSATRQGDRERCRQLKIDRQISKPIKHSELLMVIRDAVGLVPDAEDLATTTDNASWAAGESPGRYLSILVAEDNVVNQRLATGVLTKLGHKVTLAATGKEALQQFQESTFDVILMDVQMPEMDGFEATRQIRRLEGESGTRIPIIAMTARAMQGDREACLAAGMDDYLPKPVRASEISAVLAGLEGQEDESAQRAEVATPEFEAVHWPAALEYVGGNAELLDGVLEALLEEGPQLIAKLATAVASGDAALTQRTAHALKGSLLFLGSTAAVRLARELEQIGHGGSMERAADVFGKLWQSTDELFAQINAYRAG